MTEKQDIALAATLDCSRPISRRPIMAIVASAMATCFAGVLGSIIFDIGKDADTTTVDKGFTRKLEDKYATEHPTIVISYLGQDAHEVT